MFFFPLFSLFLRTTAQDQCVVHFWAPSVPSVGNGVTTQPRKSVTHHEPKLLRILNHTGNYRCSRWGKGGRMQNGTRRMNDCFEKVCGEKIRKKKPQNVPTAFLVGSFPLFFLFFWIWQCAYATFIIWGEKFKNPNYHKAFSYSTDWLRDPVV